MSNAGRIQHTLVIVVPPEHVEEGRRIFASHAAWMRQTHAHKGAGALLSYDVSEGRDLANPLDPDSATGDTCFVVSEVYQSESGVDDHLSRAQASWEEFPTFMAWMDKCRPSIVRSARIFNSLW